MSWSKPFSDVEIAYVEKSYPRLTCAEIARKLGRSKRGVELLVRRLGLREAPAPATPARAPAQSGAPTDAPCEAQDELAELRELKRMLKRSMREEAGPQALPKLAAEFRETVKRISELEGGDDGGGTGKAAADAGSILVAVPLRPA